MSRLCAKSQHSAIVARIEKLPFTNTKFIYDDGYTGTNFVEVR